MLTKRSVLKWHNWQEHSVLCAMLIVSWVLRIVLVIRGGQFWSYDERLYLDTLDFTYYLTTARPREMLEILARPYHTGFTLIGVLPALAQRILMSSLDLPRDYTWWAPAVLLSLASVACIGLVYGIVRKAGGSKSEGLMAALLMACATTMYYWARHLIPYDSALAFALLGLWIGVDERPNFWQSVICGVVAGLAFVVYHGYWIIVLIVGLVHVSWGKHSSAEVTRRMIGIAAGMSLLPFVLTVLTISANLTPYVIGVLDFNKGVTQLAQGDFSEGWSFPWEYLWHAEHGLLVLWMVGAATAFWPLVKPSSPAHRRGLLWLGAAVVVYFLLFSFSNILLKFPVNGRAVRQIVPFLCMLTAYGITHVGVSQSLELPLRLFGAGALVVQAGLNFAQPLEQQWPPDIARQVVTTLGDVAFDYTVEEPYVPLKIPQPVPTSGARYVLLNPINFWFPVTGTKTAPEGETLIRIKHPLEFLPYQYEGWKRAERSILRTTDISIRLIDTQAQKRSSAHSVPLVHLADRPSRPERANAFDHQPINASFESVERGAENDDFPGWGRLTFTGEVVATGWRRSVTGNHSSGALELGLTDAKNVYDAVSVEQPCGEWVVPGARLEWQADVFIPQELWGAYLWIGAVLSKYDRYEYIGIPQKKATAGWETQTTYGHVPLYGGPYSCKFAVRLISEGSLNGANNVARFDNIVLQQIDESQKH